jgi:hypothetical protein
MYSYLPAIIMMLLTACGSTSILEMETWEPAPVSFKKDVKKIGIVNESRPYAGHDGYSQLEQLVFLRDEKLAQFGIVAAMEAVRSGLQKDPLVDTVLLLEQIPGFTWEHNATDETIPWDQIERTCHRYGLDAIFSLSSYETDTKVSLKKSSMEETDMLRVSIKIPAQAITLETLLENGWRIYDPAHRVILDEITYNNEFTTTAKGINPVRALQAVTGRRDSLMHKSMRNGKDYGLRLQPFSHQVSREYYVSGTGQMKSAQQSVLEGDMAAAAGLWEKGLAHNSSRIRGRSYYNLAVYKEYMGNLDGALEDAKMAYDIYPVKIIGQYIKIIGHRKAKEILLRQQLDARALLLSESK